MRVDVQWGPAGAARAADVAIIVDVLSFSTCVAVALERGARIYPFWGDAAECDALALRLGAMAAAKRRRTDTPSLSPASLASLGMGDELVLPSPNGARCSLEASAKDVLCGSLRNASAVAEAAARAGGDVLVVPAGERWPDASDMRVAFEDLVGAGAIVAALAGEKTPEARAAAAAFDAARPNLHALLLDCPSGHELVGRGYAGDVAIAAALNVSAVAPLLAQHRLRYRDALPGCDRADRRIRYYEDAA